MPWCDTFKQIHDTIAFRTGHVAPKFNFIFVCWEFDQINFMNKSQPLDLFVNLQGCVPLW